MAKKFAAASATFVTTSLTFKLSMCNQDEPVDMGNLRCPKTFFVAQHFYMVEWLNIARAIFFDAFRSVFRPMWRISTPCGNIIEVPLDFVWIWVEIMGFPETLSAVATTRLVAETIGTVFQVNDGGFQRDVVRVQKRPILIREVPSFPSPSKITGVRRDREEEEKQYEGKLEKHALGFVPFPLNPKEIGFTVSDKGALKI
ncbi:hypothetical protein ACLB2K_030405 [Fragaria x ananassa]